MNPRGRPKGENRDSPLWKPPSRKDLAASRGELDLFNIQLLADCKEHIPALSQLWFDELGQKWIPNASIERAQVVYQTHLNKDQLPLTWVAIYQDHPIGMVSLRSNDGIREGLMPWLGSLIIHPDYRRQKIGEKLIEVTKENAKKMGYQTLYLFALDLTIPTWYTKLGWESIGVDQLYHHPVTVMKINL